MVQKIQSNRIDWENTSMRAVIKLLINLPLNNGKFYWFFSSRDLIVLYCIDLYENVVSELNRDIKANGKSN